MSRGLPVTKCGRLKVKHLPMMEAAIFTWVMPSGLKVDASLAILKHFLLGEGMTPQFGN